VSDLTLGWSECRAALRRTGGGRPRRPRRAPSLWCRTTCCCPAFTAACRGLRVDVPLTARCSPVWRNKAMRETQQPAGGTEVAVLGHDRVRIGPAGIIWRKEWSFDEILTCLAGRRAGAGHRLDRGW